MTIYPSLRYHDARAAIDFLTEAFGFSEKEVHAGPDGNIAHAELTGFGGVVMLGTEPEGGDALRRARRRGLDLPVNGRPRRAA